MHQFTRRWLWAVLAAVGLCALSAETRGQDVRPMWPSAGPAGRAHDVPGALAADRSAASFAGGRPALRLPVVPDHWPAGESDLAAQVAQLRLEVDKLKASEVKAAQYPTVRVGGRLMADWASFSQNDASKAQADDFENGTEIRHARLFLRGDASECVDYKLQFEIAKTTEVRNPVGTGTKGIGQISFKDIYVTVKELPVLGNVRIGHFKTPFALEQLTSFRFSTFMERAMVMEGEVEGRRMGVMAFDHAESERSTWAIGAFTSQIPGNPPIFRNDSGGTGAIMRYTFLPWYDEAAEGRDLLHLGICYAYADIPGGNKVNFFERPEAHLARVIIDAGELTDVGSITSMCAEASLVRGPWSFQAEFVPFWLDRAANPDALFHGAYAYVSYFLTGENRRYVRSRGVFDRVRPLEDFFRVRDADGCIRTGKGAWEIAYRYSYMDLNGNGINGGRADNHTFGLNWYLNPYTELMWNYVHSETRDHPDAPGTGRADIFQMRCRVSF